MYELIALCVCTSCLSCICCFVTGALCVIPKLLQLPKDLDDRQTKRSGTFSSAQQNEKFSEKNGKKSKDCHDADTYRKVNCECPKKIIIHSLPIEEEKTCGLKRRDDCTCAPLRIDANSKWK